MPGPRDDAPPRPVDGHAACVRGCIDTVRMLDAVRDVAAGGNVLFIGTTRGTTDGVVTRALEYDAHEPLALATLEALRREAIDRYALVACAVVHRLGTVLPGEASVAVATSAPHRAAAFAAAEWLMAAIKRDVPIWKGELGPGGRHEWLHPESAPRPGAAG